MVPRLRSPWRRLSQRMIHRRMSGNQSLWRKQSRMGGALGQVAGGGELLVMSGTWLVAGHKERLLHALVERHWVWAEEGAVVGGHFGGDW